MRWNIPREGLITWNIDGARKGNPGRSAYGFFLNRGGNLIYAEVQNIGMSTSIQVELMAMWSDLHYCLRHDFQHVNLETDSLVPLNMIFRNWRIPWDLVERLEDIQEMFKQMHVRIHHIFREANKMEDFIANTTSEKEEKQKFHNFIQLPSMGRWILNIASIRSLRSGSKQG